MIDSKILCKYIYSILYYFNCAYLHIYDLNFELTLSCVNLINTNKYNSFFFSLYTDLSTLSTTDHPRTHDLYIFRTDGDVMYGASCVAGKSANLILSHSLLLLHIPRSLNTLNYCYRNKYECVLSAHTLRHANKKIK